MTVTGALQEAARHAPLDVWEKLEYIGERIDTADEHEKGTWLYVYTLTRMGAA